MKEPIVYVVDDDTAMEESLSWIIESVGFKVKSFTRSEDFLSAFDPLQPGCLLLDVRMPGISGPELQGIMRERGIVLPIIFISGHGDVPLAVRAMKAGAIDFLTKPFNDQILLETINKAIRLDLDKRATQHKSQGIKNKADQLTPREFEVMSHIVAGKLNKVISANLNISLKTVEAHRANVMRKMEVRSLPELVEMVIKHDLCKQTIEE
jgi:two-component system response regulator FixJ